MPNNNEYSENSISEFSQNNDKQKQSVSEVNKYLALLLACEYLSQDLGSVNRVNKVIFNAMEGNVSDLKDKKSDLSSLAYYFSWEEARRNHLPADKRDNATISTDSKKTGQNRKNSRSLKFDSNREAFISQFRDFYYAKGYYKAGYVITDKVAKNPKNANNAFSFPKGNITVIFDRKIAEEQCGIKAKHGNDGLSIKRNRYYVGLYKVLVPMKHLDNARQYGNRIEMDANLIAEREYVGHAVFRNRKYSVNELLGVPGNDLAVVTNSENQSNKQWVKDPVSDNDDKRSEVTAGFEILGL